MEQLAGGQEVVATDLSMSTNFLEMRQTSSQSKLCIIILHCITVQKFLFIIILPVFSESVFPYDKIFLIYIFLSATLFHNLLVLVDPIAL